MLDGAGTDGAGTDGVLDGPGVDLGEEDFTTHITLDIIEDLIVVIEATEEMGILPITEADIEVI